MSEPEFVLIPNDKPRLVVVATERVAARRETEAGVDAAVSGLLAAIAARDDLRRPPAPWRRAYHQGDWQKEPEVWLAPMPSGDLWCRRTLHEPGPVTKSGGCERCDAWHQGLGDLYEFLDAEDWSQATG